MTRENAVSLVLLLVFLSVALRWVPSDDPTNPLGIGAPYETLLFDQRLADLHDDPPAMRARMRAGLGDAMPSNLIKWTRLIGKADRLIDEFAGPPGRIQERAVIHLRSFPRNDFWLLTYLLYPLHTVGRWYEDGGRKDDPLDPRAVADYTNRLIDYSDLSPEQAAEYHRMLKLKQEMRRR